MTFIVVLFAALLVASPAAADPATLIIASLGGTASIGVVGAAFIRIGVAIAFSALANAIASNQNGAPSGGVKTNTLTAGDQTPQSFILGRYMTAGNLVAPEMSHGIGGDTQFLTRVVDLGDKGIEGIDRLIVDGRPVLLNGAVHPTFGTGTLQPDFADALWCKFYDGTQTVADSYLRDIYGSYPERPWLADMIGRAVPYAILTFKWVNSPQVWQGRPDVKFVLDGLKMYDPRKDSTAGGSGLHRFGTPATHEFTQNPVVMIYNILRGISIAGGFTYGGGFAAADLPYSTWAAAMNVCGQTVAGRTQYTAGYEVKIGTPDIGGEVPMDVIDELLKACSAEIADVGGTIFIRVGGPGLPVRFISDEDILRSSDQDLDPFPPVENSYNGVHATYPDPAELWQAKEAPPVYDQDALEDDGGQRLIADLQLPAVTVPAQVQQLMTGWLKDDRRHRKHNVTLPPEGILINPLDTISWTSPRNGYVDKAFEVSQVGIDPRTLSTTLALRERDPDDYDWAIGNEITITPPSLTPVRPGPVAPPGWAVTAQAVQDAGGTNRRPAIRMAWNQPIPGAREIRWQIRLVATGVVVATGIADVDNGFHTHAAGILPSTAYEARGQLIMQKPTEWSAWLSATTGPLFTDTADLRQNAVTIPVRAQTGGNIRISSPVTWVEIIKLTINRQAFANEIRWSCGLAGFGHAVAHVALFRGETKLNEIAQTIGLNGRAVVASWNFIDWNTATGNTTYSLRVRRGDKSPYDYDVQVGVRFLSVIQFKR